ncbi:hypothetical protein SLEP1_g27999 [Rubroshorea leprosula]|uniref:Uncharacterized protein n=1 Tax=Rubroshorea leprosula TaxID=152421 RepID=A0AAV5JS70_9ROSI|nr:hypothetical protein SLEP1_g27999 [Rubroshorea leprosula]
MLEPPCAPSSYNPFGSSDPRLYPANLVRCSLFLVCLQIRRWSPPSGSFYWWQCTRESQIWQPRDPLAASRIGLRLIGTPHRHPGAWHTFHMSRLKDVPFRSLD